MIINIVLLLANSFVCRNGVNIMTASLLSVIILIVFITTAMIEIYRSMTRELKRSAVTLGNIILSIICAVIVSPLLSDSIVDGLFYLIAPNIAGYNQLISSYGEFEPLLMMCASALLSTLLFVPIFFAIRGIFAAIIAMKLFNSTQENNEDSHRSERKFFKDRKSEHIVKVFIGLLCAVLITSSLTAPLMGILRVADDVLEMAEDGSPQIWDNIPAVKKEVDQARVYSNDVVGNIFYEIGGKYIFRAAAKGNIYGDGVYLINEIESVEVILHDFLDAYSVLRTPQKATRDDISKLEKVRDDIQNINACHGVLSGYFSDCAEAWLNGKLFLLMRRPSIHPITDPVVNEILEICCYSNEENVKDNVTTVLNVCIIVLESGVVELGRNDHIGLARAIEESNLVENIDKELKKNPNMAHIDVTSISMNALVNVINSSKHTQKLYSEFIDNMTDAINTVQNRGYSSTEEKTTVLTSYTEKYLANLGVSVPDVVLESAVESMINYIDSGMGEITPEQVREMFEK